jgi:aspartate kinase
MALIVQKYGGTSVANAEKIAFVAERVIRAQEQGNQVVVVVSAMAGQTNYLVDMARQVNSDPRGREYDLLLSSGEQVTIALLALALQGRGVQASAFLGHQVRIITDNAFNKARIKSIDASKIHEELAHGHIVVVAGFQGMDEDGNITTLGRGGSDTTAVALASALKADACQIYTDVDGVYTADPRICPEASLIKKISYEEMLELASAGAKVLQNRSVELAAKFHVPVWVRSTFSEEEGTLVTQEDATMEELLVSGVTYNKDESKVAVRHLADQPGIAARLFQPIADANINVDMIIQNVSEDGFTDLTFTVPNADLKQAVSIAEETSKSLGGCRIETDANIAKISVVGVGMRSHAGIAAMAFTRLAEKGINIQMISTSEIKISMVVSADKLKEAVAELHDAFDLGNKKQ